MNTKAKVFISILAILLNYLTAGVFYNLLKLPLFFDTIWTVVVVFWIGLVPGICVAVGYNLLNYAVWILKDGSQNFIFLYAICGILIVFSTWIFARKKEDFQFSRLVTFLYLFLITLVSVFCTIVAGGLIDYFLYFHQVSNANLEEMNPIKEFTDAFLLQKFSLLSSCILAQIPVSFVDRFIATFFGFGIYRLLEKHTKGRFYV